MSRVIRRYAIATWHLLLSPVGFVLLIFVLVPAVVEPLLDRLASSGLDTGSRAVIAFYSGMLAGAAWYRIHPKPFIDRVMGAALACAVLIPLVLVEGGAEGSWEPESALVLGLLTGLVLTEGWIERRSTRRPEEELVPAER